MDTQSYTLTIGGEVDRPVVLRYDELLRLPTVERRVLMNCANSGVSHVVMRGVALVHLFDLAGVRDTARLAAFTCSDGHRESASLFELLAHDAFLVYSADGGPLDEFGQPLRLCIPGRYAARWAKGVQGIEIT